jgi:hypothetical protein
MHILDDFGISSLPRPARENHQLPKRRHYETRVKSRLRRSDPSLKTRSCRTGNSVPPAARFGPPVRQTLGVCGYRMSYAAGAHCHRFATLRSSVGHRERHETTRVQTLIARPSIETLNHRILHGLPGWIKSNLTPWSYAQASRTFAANSLPLSTVIICGYPLRLATRSRAATTVVPVSVKSASIIDRGNSSYL